MELIGLAAEYNPLHQGHAWQLAELRRRFGADSILAVCMSGCFTQRGEPALFSKYARAEAAVRCGADLVLELPLAGAIGPAERFADRAVSVLAALGCLTRLAFGSECADPDRLRFVRGLIRDADWERHLPELLAKGVGFADARQTALEREAGGALPELRARNDILALAYLAALERIPNAPEPTPLPRNPVFPAASELRARADLLEQLPPESAGVFRRETAMGRIVRPGSLDTAILAKLRSMTEADWRALPDLSEGIENRLQQAARQAGTLEELTALATTKRYPAARLRRLALSAFLGLTAADAAEPPAYLRVLALNARGAALLHRASPSLPVISKPADGMKIPQAAREAAACGLYVLGYENPSERRGDTDIRTSPYFGG